MPNTIHFLAKFYSFNQSLAIMAQKGYWVNWDNILKQEQNKPYYQTLSKQLNILYNTKKIYPPKHKLFEAFKLCSFQNLKVVILGQDPYHQANQAIGVAFGVDSDTKLPPSLLNIFKEIKSNTKQLTTSRNLYHLASQGVLLLNTILSVEDSKPNSHKDIGWIEFTNSIIKTISTKKENIVFLLWGNNAISKEILIDQTKHTILKATHPSPLGANNKKAKYPSFIGCGHFEQTNKILRKIKQKEIIW